MHLFLFVHHILGTENPQLLAHLYTVQLETLTGESFCEQLEYFTNKTLMDC